MKALIAFIVLALLVLTLIEINERIKAKRKPASDASLKGKEDECPTDHPDAEDCSGCGLIEICEKEEKKKTGQ